MVASVLKLWLMSLSQPLIPPGLKYTTALNTIIIIVVVTHHARLTITVHP